YPGERVQRTGQLARTGRHRRVAQARHLLDVSAGGEDFWPPVHDDGFDLFGGCGLLGRFAQLLLHLAVEGVHGRSVQPDCADAVTDVQLNELAHGLSPQRRCRTGSVPTPDDGDGFPTLAGCFPRRDPAPSGVALAGVMSTTYYHDDAVHITSGGVHVGGAWYPLSTLTYVWHRRTGRLRHGAYVIASRTAAIGVVVALLVGGGMIARNI